MEEEGEWRRRESGGGGRVEEEGEWWRRESEVKEELGVEVGEWRWESGGGEVDEEKRELIWRSFCFTEPRWINQLKSKLSSVQKLAGLVSHFREEPHFHIDQAQYSVRRNLLTYYSADNS